MSETSKQPKEELLHLREENKSLRSDYERLQQLLTSYEQIIGEGNTNVLRSDMARMELEQIFSAYSDAMWVVREDGIVIRANNAMLQMLGKTEADVIGKVCSSFLDYKLCATEDCPLKNISAKKNYNDDIQLTNPNTKSNHYLLTTAPLITIDGTPGIVAQFKDITSRKKAEEALEETNKILEKMTLRDGLTQIANRRCFDETMQREWQRMQREQQPLSVILSDIDFFKKYNDHYGHQEGDDCLRQVAQALEKTTMRPADTAARYGGEEFAIILPNTNREGARHLGENVLQAIRELNIEHKKSDVNSVVTISLGAATLVPTAETAFNDLIKMADEALYQAKDQGRDRIISTQ